MRKKKSLGQHFLNDMSIAKAIVDGLQLPEDEQTTVFEIGPGEGVLTQYLVCKTNINFYAIELDRRLPAFLTNQYPLLSNRLIHADVLKVNFEDYTTGSFAVIGNFPYNISSQIIFKLIDYKSQVTQMVGMFQKEVAERIAAPHGSRTYGVISVLSQLYFKPTYLFEVSSDKFTPPPKVQSAVIRLDRRYDYEAQVNYSDFKKVVKQAFSQRRKKLRNALKSLTFDMSRVSEDLFEHRAEHLSIEDFIQLTNALILEEKAQD